ncbi:MAG: hypothetical protein ACTTJI_02665 [Capnocytophaga sp.]|uniref:hypothetical protein n=1 Tax=Capnocytophaga sp. TaxID=44737 RepID=UPI003F9EEE9A
MKNYLQHCVMFSIVSLSELLKEHPERIILCSKGVTFVHTLDVLNINVKNTPQESLDLKPYFKNDYIVSDDRHSVANWWGVYCLYTIEKALKLNDIVPKNGFVTTGEQLAKDLLEKAWEEMNSYKGLVARYFNPIDEENILIKLKEIEEQAKEFFNQDRLLLVEDNIKKIENFIALNEGTKRYFLPQEKLRLDEEMKDLIRKLLSPEEKYVENTYKGRVRTVLSESLKKEIFIKKGNLEALLLDKVEQYKKQMEDFDTKEKEIKNMKEWFHYNNPYIIYVDDQANDGWAKVFKKIIYGNSTEEIDNFKVIAPKKEDTIDEIVTLIIDAKGEKKQKAILLILDLRLYQERGTIPVNQLSGFKVLEKLKEKHFSMPILLTTASNKWQSYSQMIDLGVLYYWQKKGLDEQNDSTTLANNYYDFLKGVYLLCSDQKIQFLYSIFFPTLYSLKKEENNLWWTTKFWLNPSIIASEVTINELIHKRTIKDSPLTTLLKVTEKIVKRKTTEQNAIEQNAIEQNAIEIKQITPQTFEIKYYREEKGKENSILSFEKSVLTEGQKKKIWNLLERACQIYLDLCHKRLQGNRFYRVEENTIVFNLFLVVETIYKLGKKYKLIKYDKKAKVLTPEKYQCVMNITDLRNDVYHNGKELSDRQLIKYMEQTLRLLENSRNYTSQPEISLNEEVVSSKSEEVSKDFEQEESVKAKELACSDDLKNTSQFLKGEKITFNLKEIKGLEAVGNRTYFVPIEVQFENEALVQESLKNVEKKSQNSSKSSSFVLFKDQEYTTTVKGIDEQKRCLLLSPLSPETIGEKYMCENVINYISERDILVAFNDLSSLERFKNRIGENINFKPDEVKLGSLFATLVADLWNEEIYESTITEVNNKWVKLSPVEEGGLPVKAKVENIVLPKATSKRADYLKVGRTLKFTIKNITDVWIRPEKIWAEDQNPLESKQE